MRIWPSVRTAVYVPSVGGVKGNRMGTGTAFAEDAKENIVVSSIKDTDSKKYDACCAEGVFKFYGEPEKDWAAGRALWWPVLAGRCLG